MLKALRVGVLAAILTVTVLSVTGCPRRTLVLPAAETPAIVQAQ